MSKITTRNALFMAEAVERAFQGKRTIIYGGNDDVMVEPDGWNGVSVRRLPRDRDAECVAKLWTSLPGGVNAAGVRRMRWKEGVEVAHPPPRPRSPKPSSAASTKGKGKR